MLGTYILHADDSRSYTLDISAHLQAKTFPVKLRRHMAPRVLL